MNQPPNVLYYSSNCKACIYFLNTGKSFNILKFFRLECIDNKIHEYKSKGLQSVPTIILNIQNANTRKILQGEQCISWLKDTINAINSSNKIENNNVIKRSSITTNTSNTTTNTTNNINNNINNDNNNNNNNNNIPIIKKQPFGYLKDEMEGLSDSFAYLMTDNPTPKSFMPCNSEMNIYTAPENDKIDKRKQELMMRNMENVRENDKTEFKKMIEEQHRNIINNNK